jgi:hypothetical protein
MGTLITVVLIAGTCRWPRPWESLLATGREGPAARVVHADFPGLALSEGEGHDGQLAYVEARAPWHLREVARQLDRPRYRLQRPLLPWLAWMLHPTSGGAGLALALFAVGVVGVFLGGLGVGLISVTLRGPPWVAGLYPLVGGSWWALRVTAPDGLAIGLALLAVALSLRRRHAAAVAVAVAAVLAKEASILVLLGYLLWRRRREAAWMLLVSGAVAITWAGVLHFAVPQGRPNAEFAWPLEGLLSAAGSWVHGKQLVSPLWVAAGLALGVLALRRRGLHHPLGCAVVVQFVFLSFLSRSVFYTWADGPRAVLALTALAMLVLATPRAGAAVMDDNEEERGARNAPTELAIEEPISRPLAVPV